MRDGCDVCGLGTTTPWTVFGDFLCPDCVMWARSIGLAGRLPTEQEAESVGHEGKGEAQLRREAASRTRDDDHPPRRGERLLIVFAIGFVVGLAGVLLWRRPGGSERWSAAGSRRRYSAEQPIGRRMASSRIRTAGRSVW
jgi:hypothetical protein